jgi:hypothetical protein
VVHRTTNNIVPHSNAWWHYNWDTEALFRLPIRIFHWYLLMMMMMAVMTGSTHSPHRRLSTMTVVYVQIAVVVPW